MVLVLNAFGIFAALVFTALIGWPNWEGNVGIGYPRLLVPEAEVALDGALAPGTHAGNVTVEVSAYNGGWHP